MTTNAKLTAKSPVAQLLIDALKNGSIPRSITGKRQKESSGPVAEALLPYDTKSINNFLARYRKKLDDDGS